MKILCFGDSQGDFSRTVEKARLLQAKQKFDCLLCLGDLFSSSSPQQIVDDLLQKKHVIPLPIYFTEGRLGIPQSLLDLAAANAGSICENLYLLGSSGSLRLSEGFKIAYRSAASTSLEEFSNKNLPITDILLSKEKLEEEFSIIVPRIKPKYLFYPADTFLEHPSYKVPLSNGEFRVTREIALAAVANESKSKWFYAFNLTDVGPDATMLKNAKDSPYLKEPGTQSSASVVKNPEGSSKLDDRDKIEDDKIMEKRPPSGYVCKLCSVPDEHYFRDCPNKSQTRKRKRGPEKVISAFIDPATCFFCLANPNLARHLIVSIGDDGSYLVLPKGGLTQYHVIILPVDHKPTMLALQETRDAVEGEMTRYVDALERFYESLNMVGVLFEISRSSGVHFHKQMMPVPQDRVQDLIDAFFAFSETEALVLEERALKAGDENYFRILFPASGKSMVGTLEPRKRFDLQFGRRVISDVMGVPERAHWKDCVRSDEQETADADLFKAAFKAFDFAS